MGYLGVKVILFTTRSFKQQPETLNPKPYTLNLSSDPKPEDWVPNPVLFKPMSELYSFFTGWKTGMFAACEDEQ